ncbi:MAG: polyphenol oxidase family protein [Oscillospiraceae bacterium]|nr:polyphenol oxidase family protein [Oscillospiraceae bacterium]
MFTPREKDTVKYYTSDALTGAPHAFSTRAGGVSAPPRDTLNLGRADCDPRAAENFRRFTAAFGADAASLVFAKQAHGDGVATVTPEHRGSGFAYPAERECDALITGSPGLTLTVFWADCAPVLLYDARAGAAGAAHAGWRGAALDTAGKTARALAALSGGGTGGINAAVGPCIGMCCFETDADVPEAFIRAFGQSDMRPYIEPSGGGRFRVDLAGIVEWQLRRAGVGLVDRAGLCTCCRDGEFFSHRRMGERRGSQAACIAVL